MSEQDKDKELITKGAAFKAVDQMVYAFVKDGASLSPKDLKAAIDALEPACTERSERVLPASPGGQGPDYKAMWEELFDREDTSLALRDVMKEIKARHTPPGAEKSHTSRTNVREKPVIQYKAEKEKCPVCGGEGTTRKPLAMGSCDRCGGTGRVNRAGADTEKPEGEG